MNETVASDKSSSPLMAVILGMHRSGTSVLTHLLAEAGFYIAPPEDILGPGDGNPDGHFERKSVIAANEMLLAICDGRWDAPPSENDLRRVRIDPWLERLVRPYQGKERVVLKDPRLCLTFPVWEPFLGDNIRIIRMTRPANEVAASLAKRNFLPLARCLNLWQIYNERADAYAAPYPTFVLNYEELFAEHRPETLRRLAEFLAIDADLEAIALTIVKETLRHHGAGAVDSKVPPLFDKQRSETQSIQTNRLPSGC